MRVVGVAQKKYPLKETPTAFSVKDEHNMILTGFLAFLDPPKETAQAAIRALNEYGVTVKVLTGDNDSVTQCVCRQVGLAVGSILLGADVEKMTDADLRVAVEKTNVFAKLSPEQKSRIVKTLRQNGHTVGYMGDGINDAAAMRAADVGISVDNAVDIAKEAANIILLEKDLMILEQGIVEGRKIYGNIVKYVKMTASSNFGNMFAVLVAAVFVPFLPMLPIQILMLNLIYDISCASMPWDNVDREFLLKPRKWEAKSIMRFTLWFGPTSSLFDIGTYGIMYWLVCPAMMGGRGYGELATAADQMMFQKIFQAGWFVESLATQTLVIQILRSPKFPFIGTHASWQVTMFTFTGIAVGIALPFIPFVAGPLNMAPLGLLYFGMLAAVIIAYLLLVTLFKHLFVKRYKELL
jgi:Mg2+-importing ATPase